MTNRTIPLPALVAGASALNVVLLFAPAGRRPEPVLLSAADWLVEGEEAAPSVRALTVAGAAALETLQ